MQIICMRIYIIYMHGGRLHLFMHRYMRMRKVHAKCMQIAMRMQFACKVHADCMRMHMHMHAESVFFFSVSPSKAVEGKGIKKEGGGDR